MASGKDLKRRIASVNSTRQITKAMKMVAAARLRRAQDAILKARPFAVSIRDVVGGLLQNSSIRESHPLLSHREVKKVNVILVTSDRGLCGSFNTNLLKRAESLYKTEGKKYEKFAFTCFGKKGYEYLSLRKIPIQKYHQDFFKGFKYAKVHAVAEEILAAYLSGEFDEIRVIFAEFRSAISQVVTQQTLLPVEPAALEEGKSATDYIYEPGQGEILEKLLPRYFIAQLYRAMLETQASEHGARMAAMDNATKNAGEMIRKLTLEFNKVRQAGITKELLEIVSGAEALK